jgi:hypothetical protein
VHSWAKLPLSVDPLVNGTRLLIWLLKNNLTDQRFFLTLKTA